jgi:hypothetical protein
LASTDRKPSGASAVSSSATIDTDLGHHGRLRLTAKGSPRPSADPAGVVNELPDGGREWRQAPKGAVGVGQECRPSCRPEWRTGSEARISTLKRQYCWDRTRIDNLDGARIRTGHAVLIHNLIKIATMTG